MSRIDNYLDAIFDAFSAAGRIVPWPINIANIFPYFDDLEARDLFDRLKNVAPEGAERVAEMFVNPSVTRALLMDTIPNLKSVNELSTDDRVWFAETIFDALETVQFGDIFCRDGRYLKMNSEQVAERVGSEVWMEWDSDPATCASAYRVSASAQALIWSLFFYGWTDVAFEIHGPYRVETEDADLIVRDFFDLAPVAVWPDMPALPFNKISVLALMRPEAGSRVDMFNHLTHAGNLNVFTRRIAVQVDDRPVTDKKELVNLTRVLTGALTQQHGIVESMERNKLIHKFIETRYYAYRKWREPFGEDWRPPAEVWRRITLWDPIDIPLEGGPSKQVLRRAYDPRDSFNFGEE